MPPPVLEARTPHAVRTNLRREDSGQGSAFHALLLSRRLYRYVGQLLQKVRAEGSGSAIVPDGTLALESNSSGINRSVLGTDVKRTEVLRKLPSRSGRFKPVGPRSILLQTRQRRRAAA